MGISMDQRLEVFLDSFHSFDVIGAYKTSFIAAIVSIVRLKLNQYPATNFVLKMPSVFFYV